MLTLSLIIPVYNEERHMKACLEAVKKQTIKPTEVIVVDNNCTDKTIQVAKKYDFVTIIKEKKQGLTYARNTGFNAASSDILGRIDADSVIAENWVECVLQKFSADDSLQGSTGLASTYLFPFAQQFTLTTVSRAYLLYIEADYRIDILWGANMALRRSAWDKVRGKVTLDDAAVHEDQDLSCWLASESLKVQRNNRMVMRSIDDSLAYLPKFIEYDKRRVRTKKLHKKMGTINRKNRSITNPIKIIIGLTIGNIFRLYFWTGGSVLLFTRRNKTTKRTQ